MVGQNIPQKQDTATQLTVAGWLSDIGLRVFLEENFGPYIVDIFLPEINLAVELDGPIHRKKRDEERDNFLKDQFNLEVWRFKNKEIKADFRSEFEQRIQQRIEEYLDAKT